MNTKMMKEMLSAEIKTYFLTILKRDFDVIKYDRDKIIGYVTCLRDLDICLSDCSNSPLVYDRDFLHDIQSEVSDMTWDFYFRTCQYN